MAEVSGFHNLAKKPLISGLDTSVMLALWHCAMSIALAIGLKEVFARYFVGEWSLT